MIMNNIINDILLIFHTVVTIIELQNLSWTNEMIVHSLFREMCSRKVYIKHRWGPFYESFLLYKIGMNFSFSFVS